MSSNKKQDNAVTVGVRIRPRNEKELAAMMPVCFSATEDAQGVEELDEHGSIVKVWPYDYVFGHECTNQYIFHSVGAKLIDAALEGYNTVLFMYGQTSSGKTFTLFGGASIAGLVEHAMEYAHNKIMTSTDTEYVIKVTYTELYNEVLKDLLAPVPTDNLKIIDDPTLGPQIQNITEAPFTSAAGVKKLLEEGEQKRHFGVTNMNAHSSRSHVMVRLHIETRKVNYKPDNPLRNSWGKDRPTTMSTLNLVDLAGSERANKSGTTGQGFVEGKFINQSLLTLGTVISSLSEGKAGQHVPYRNSKLTRLLASALGGNAKTCMITCISPASGNVQESLSTLRFASRAKHIVNQVQRNELQDAKSLAQKLATQNAEIEELRQRLELSRQLGFVPGEGQGETLKEKAVAASKNWRTMKFFITNTSKIVKELKQTGQSNLAKKVQQDFKSAIAGHRDMAEFLEEQSSIIYTYLPNQTQLIQKVEGLMRENESDAILDPMDMDASLDELGDEGDGQELGGFDFDGEEWQEKLEGCQMQYEHLLAAAMMRITSLEEEKSQGMLREKKYGMEIDDLRSKLMHVQETLKRLQTNEVTLQKTLEESKKMAEEEQESSVKYTERLQSRIGELESLVSERDGVIDEHRTTLIAKDNEIDRLKSRCETLQKDAQAANTSKRAFEEEVARTKNEMRTQMDRLRANMHNLLKQGGEEAKVIESQNEILQREADNLRDALDDMQQLKNQLSMENIRLRAEMSTSMEKEKQHIEELNNAKDQVSKLAIKLQHLRSELTQAEGALQASEISNGKLRNQILEECREKEAMQLEKEEESRRLKACCETKMTTMQAEMESLLDELQLAKDSAESKQNIIQKMELSFSADSQRLEKKYQQQIKWNEELQEEHQSSLMKLQQELGLNQAECRRLEAKIVDLESNLATVNRFLEDQLVMNGTEFTEGSGSEEDIRRRKESQDSSSVESHHQQRSLSVVTQLDDNNHFHSRSATMAMSDSFTPSSLSHLEIHSPSSTTSSNRLRRASSMNSMISVPPPPSSDSDWSPSPPLRNHKSMGGADIGMPDVLNDAEREQRIDKILLQLTRDSAKSRNLKQGLQLLTANLKVALHKSRLYWSILREDHRDLASQNYSQAYVIDSLSQQYSLTIEGLNQAKDSLGSFRTRDDQMTLRNEELEHQFGQLRSDYNKLILTAQELEAKLDQCVQSNQQLMLINESIRQEKQTLEATNNRGKKMYDSLAEEAQELMMKYMDSEGIIAHLQEQLAVLEAERDELYRRFVGKEAPPLQFALTPTALSGYYNAEISLQEENIHSSPSLSSRNNNSLRIETPSIHSNSNSNSNNWSPFSNGPSSSSSTSSSKFDHKIHDSSSSSKTRSPSLFAMNNFK